MVNLSDSELLRIGKEIARLLPLCFAEMKSHGEHYQPEYINQIYKSERTLELLRIEWKRRHTNSF